MVILEIVYQPHPLYPLPLIKGKGEVVLRGGGAPSSLFLLAFQERGD